jgi:hypothetical protein
VPEAALFVGEDRVHRRVVQEQHAFAGFTLVVLVDGFDQHRSRGRRIALQDDLRAVINCCAQGRQGFFVLALAVIEIRIQSLLLLKGLLILFLLFLLFMNNLHKKHIF